MNKVLQSYLAELAARGFSTSLREGTIYAVEWLALYLSERWQITDWREVESRHLDGFALHLRRDHRTRQGQLLKESSVNRILSLLRTFFDWQYRRGHLLWNPAEELLPLNVEQSLPRVLSEGEITKLIETPDTSTAIGLRDRALMEVLYATGIRHREAHELDLYDVDATNQRLTVRRGKSNRDRVVPLTENAAFWVMEYLRDSRPELVRKALTKKLKKRGSQLPAPSAALWLSNSGRRFPYSSIDQTIAKYAKEAEVKACVHTFRHSCASHLLKHGASTRHIQELLGHRSLLSTQIYLHLEVEDLKRAVSLLPLSTV
jgi:integrase/recombinase XerD